MPYHFDVDAPSNGRFNEIPFHHQSKRLTNIWYYVCLLETPQSPQNTEQSTNNNNNIMNKRKKYNINNNKIFKTIIFLFIKIK